MQKSFRTAARLSNTSHKKFEDIKKEMGTDSNTQAIEAMIHILHQYRYAFDLEIEYEAFRNNGMFDGRRRS